MESTFERSGELHLPEDEGLNTRVQPQYRGRFFNEPRTVVAFIFLLASPKA